MINIEENKQEFIRLYNEYIKRDGADQLLEWIKGTDFFTAPASSVYHLAEDGGLCQHSLNVFQRLNKILGDEYGSEYPDLFNGMETIAIVSLLHDLCKADYYVKEMRNVKDDKGNWIQVPYYKVDERFHFGHGAKSVYIIQNFMQLDLDEASAIRYHMGGMEIPNVVEPNVTAVYNDYPLALYAHLADMQATYIDERIIKDND